MYLTISNTPGNDLYASSCSSGSPGNSYDMTKKTEQSFSQEVYSDFRVMGRCEGDIWGFKIHELMFRVGEGLRFCSLLFFFGGGAGD